jgi:hypothetical protein
VAREYAHENGERQPGYRFRDGRLYVFAKHQVAIIAGAPQASAVRKRDGATWEEFVPTLKLVHRYRPRRKKKPARRGPPQQSLDLFADERKSHPPPTSRIGDKRRALDAFRFSLPREVARRVEPFPNRQFAVIRCQQRYAWYDDLLDSHAPLAFCVANPSLLRRRFEQRLAGLKQRELLEHFGFPNSRSAVQTLRRLAPESLHSHHLLALRQLLKTPDRLKELRHAPIINAGVLQVLADDAVYGCVTPAFIQDVAATAAEKYCARAADLVREALHFHDVVRPTARRPLLTSIARAEAMHTELGQRYASLHKQRILECRFPRPPVAGTASIVPLRTPRDLVIEGEQQHNCVATYARWVERSEVFVYRVVAPQRATLSLRRQPDGSWGISELLAACNRRVSWQTRHAVEDWLDAL